MTFGPNNSIGTYLPETVNIPDDDKQQITYLKTRLEEILREVNRKQVGSYETIEQLTGQQFPGATPQEKKYTYRKVFNFGAIAAGATLNIAHTITGFTEFTHIYGACTTAVVDYRPIPYASATVVTQQIEVNITATNIVIINGATAPNITSGWIVVEYLKN